MLFGRPYCYGAYDQEDNECIKFCNSRRRCKRLMESEIETIKRMEERNDKSKPYTKGYERRRLE